MTRISTVSEGMSAPERPDVGGRHVLVQRRRCHERLCPIVMVLEADPASRAFADAIAAATHVLVSAAGARAADCSGVDVLVVSSEHLESELGARPHAYVGATVCVGPSDAESVRRAFSAGVDDYVRTPFKGEELAARVVAVARRSVSPGVVAFGRYRLDTSRCLLFFDGDLVHPITPQETTVLTRFAQAPGELVPAVAFLEAALSGRPMTPSHVYVMIDRLRRRLRAGTGASIETHRASGYRLLLDGCAEVGPRMWPTPEDLVR